MKSSPTRLGGQTFFRIGPLVEKDMLDADGKSVKVRRPAWSEYWVDVPNPQLPAPVPAAQPKDEKVAAFLKALARDSARVWAEAVRKKSKGEQP